MNQARIFGGAIGLACETIILSSRFSSDLSAILSASELTALRQNTHEISVLTPPQQLAVQESVGNAFRDQMRVCMYVAGVCVISSFLVFSRHPVSFQKRLELGRKIIEGELKPDVADEMLRARP